MSDPKIGVVWFILDTLDRLDSITDVGKVDKRAVLLLEEIDELNIAILAKIAFKFVIRERLEIFDIANIHVARRARVYSQSECGWKRTSVFAPTQLEPPVVQC